MTFGLTQVLSVVVVQPLLITAGVFWALVVFPALSASLSWVPGLGALLSPPGGQAGPEAATLSGRLEHVSLVQAAGAASGLPPDHALLAFSVVSSLASAMFGGLGRWRRGVTARAVATGERAQATGDTELAQAYQQWQQHKQGLPAISAAALVTDEEAPAARSGSSAIAGEQDQTAGAAHAVRGKVNYKALAAAQVARMVFSGRVPPPSSAGSLRRQVQLVATYLSRRCPPALLATMAQRYAEATADSTADDLRRAMAYFLGKSHAGASDLTVAMSDESLGADQVDEVASIPSAALDVGGVAAEQVQLAETVPEHEAPADARLAEAGLDAAVLAAASAAAAETGEASTDEPAAVTLLSGPGSGSTRSDEQEGLDGGGGVSAAVLPTENGENDRVSGQGVSEETNGSTYEAGVVAASGASKALPVPGSAEDAAMMPAATGQAFEDKQSSSTATGVEE